MSDQTYVSRQAFRDETPWCPNYSRVWNVDSPVTGGLRRLTRVGVCEHCDCEPRQIGSALRIEVREEKGDERTEGPVNTEGSTPDRDGDCCGRD